MKICNKCGMEKSVIMFVKDKYSSDGYYSSCKECKHIKSRKPKPQTSSEEKYCSTCKLIKNKMEFYKDKTHSDGLYSKCRQCSREKAKNIYCEHAEQKLEYQKKYAKLHKKERNAWAILKRKTDPLFKFKSYVRSRISTYFNNFSKPTSVESLLGCSFDFLKTYLELQFVEGMSWENYGAWHIDHIVPLASAQTKENLVKLCHYTNLQPLWLEDHKLKTKEDFKKITLARNEAKDAI